MGIKGGGTWGLTVFRQTNSLSMLNYIVKQHLDPWFVTGFTDGEGCFFVSITENTNFKVGWKVQLFFQIGLHEKDQALLEQIKKFFSVESKIGKHGPKTIQFKVISKELKIIIDHFDKYPLISEGWSDFQLFKQVLHLMEQKEHLTDDGLRQVVSIKASMNLGLSPKLKLAFPNVKPAKRPLLENKNVNDNWITGFTSAEGCFFINIGRWSKSRLGFKVELVFKLTQHKRDINLLKSFIKFFDCGNIYKKGNTFDYRVSKFSDITQKIIPFFKKHPIHGVKALDFADWCLVANMMKEKKHLTKKGLENINQIYIEMNTRRKY